jgi:uncharacterized Zn finger protein
MCKHVAAVLYGVGARLDTAPDLLFTLRGVDRADLVSTVGADEQITRLGAASERVLADVDVAALFGLDMEAPPAPAIADGREKTAQSNAATPAQAAGRTGRRRADMMAPSGRGETREPATRAAKKATHPDVTVVTREDRTGRKRSAASNEVAAPKKTAAVAKKAAKAPLSPGKPSKAAINTGSRRAGDAGVGRTRAAKTIGTKVRKLR